MGIQRKAKSKAEEGRENKKIIIDRGFTCEGEVLEQNQLCKTSYSKSLLLQGRYHLIENHLSLAQVEKKL